MIGCHSSRFSLPSNRCCTLGAVKILPGIRRRFALQVCSERIKDTLMLIETNDRRCCLCCSVCGERKLHISVSDASPIQLVLSDYRSLALYDRRSPVLSSWTSRRVSLLSLNYRAPLLKTFAQLNMLARVSHIDNVRKCSPH